MLLRVFMLGLVVTLTSCANPYVEGKSAADVPAYVSVIKLKQVAMTEFLKGSQPNGDPSIEVSPSQNDQEVIEVVRASVKSQLAEFGYKVVEGENAKPDILMSFFIFYQPEYGLLIHRSASVEARVYDPEGSPIFHVSGGSSNPSSIFSSAIYSRDQMVSAVVKDAVKKAVNELRNVTKDKVVTDAKANQ